MLLAILCTFLPASAQVFNKEGIAYNITSEQTVEVTKLNDHAKYSGHVEIPKEVEDKGKTYSIIGIGEEAFYSNIDMTSVTIPNSIIYIGADAFDKCDGLTSVVIPNSVTTVGDAAFYGCSGLTSVTIGNSVTTIGDGAFATCFELTSITIPNSVTTIGGEAFDGCSELTSVTIGNSVATIGLWAFDSCNKLTSVYCQAIEPPLCKGSTETESPQFFCENTLTNGCLYVPHTPKETQEKYSAAEVWRNFSKIVAVEYSGIDEVTTATDNISVVGTAGYIEVQNAPTNAVLQVYDLQGSLVRKTTEHTIGSLPQGSYLVCICGQSHKAVVK